MAATVSLLQIPYNYNPINAPTWIISWSQDYANPEYKYVYNLYTYDILSSTSSNFVGQYKIPPRPSGQGVFDTHKILKAQINTDRSPDMNAIMDSTSALIPVIEPDALTKFKFRYGYEQNIGMTFANTYGYNFAGATYVVIGFTQSPYYPVLKDDIITVQMNPASSNQEYNGQALVLGIISATAFYTNIPFGISESNIGGQITYLQRIVGSSSFFYGINGVRQYYDPLINNSGNQQGLQDIYTDKDLIFNGCTLTTTTTTTTTTTSTTTTTTTAYIGPSTTTTTTTILATTTTTTSTTTTTTTIGGLILINGLSSIYTYPSNPGTDCDSTKIFVSTSLYSISGNLTDGEIIYTDTSGVYPFNGFGDYYCDNVLCDIGTIDSFGLFTKTANCTYCP